MSERGKPNLEEHPETVTFHFKDAAARHQFMGGLSDGWGENYCDLDWAWASKKPVDLGDASDVVVLSSFPDGEEEE